MIHRSVSTAYFHVGSGYECAREPFLGCGYGFADGIAHGEI